MSTCITRKKHPHLLSLLFATGLVSCSQHINNPTQQQTASFSVENPSNIQRTDASISLSKSQLKQHLGDINLAAFTVYQTNSEIASQAIDSDNDGQLDGIIFTDNFDAKEAKKYTVRYLKTGEIKHNYQQRAHAELSINQGGARDKDGKFKGGEFVPVQFQALPKDHTPGDFQFRYEGPGWESDKIAYRLYFDERNVNDIFGKRVPDIVLPQVGHIGTSYHKLEPWGMDILKVGPSLGIGGVGMMVDGKANRLATAEDMTVNIIEQGPIRSHIQIKYSNWMIANNQFNVTSDLTLVAGSRLTHNQLIITGEPDNIVTGIVKHQAAEVLNSGNTGDWSYIATFGKQSDIKDEMGMVIFYRNSALIELSEDAHNHLILLQPDNGKLDYYLPEPGQKT